MRSQHQTRRLGKAALSCLAYVQKLFFLIDCITCFVISPLERGSSGKPSADRWRASSAQYPAQNGKICLPSSALLHPYNTPTTLSTFSDVCSPLCCHYSASLQSCRLSYEHSVCGGNATSMACLRQQISRARLTRRATMPLLASTAHETLRQRILQTLQCPRQT